jgi:Cu+-exporting ATPase
MPTKIRGERSTQQKDPVCGMEIDVKDAPTESIDGKSYVFCSEECREKFVANPSDYLIL